ncbi:unnamed protein product [Knipowitschia caucasica]|uniref:Uncharacterized protein n=1 Tax=Knipowitschia caucasica TaxID=637954 RepID=A0AAV2JYZ6_KNICA
MEDMAELQDMHALLMSRVQSVVTACCEYRSSLEQYAYLYVEDRREVLRLFLLHGHVLTDHERKMNTPGSIPESPPTLDCFREQVDRYEKLYEEIQALQTVYVFHGWLRVDSSSMKAALLNTVNKWSSMFKQHLMEHVINSLSELEQFISDTGQGLEQHVEKGEYSALVGLLSHLLAVKSRQQTTDAMFEPIQQTIALLQDYGQELPDMVYKHLQVRPMNTRGLLSEQ